ncbi:ORM1-like protein 1 [Gossypium australe]|uniref:ORM1-like protein 1 n=1 Tax=Gossypium australe TaxID=47621 RepID=A0A5B6UVZ3_9ROSI|nr:ORM1-like protein 1 [Gossypium australe]
MANLYVKAVPPADLNRNTEWFMYPGVWTTYILFLFFSWLLVLSIFGCSPGMAWTIVNLAHFLIPDSFAYNRLPTSYALSEHARSDHPRRCQVSKHAQGPDLRNQCRQVSLPPRSEQLISPARKAIHTAPSPLLKMEG